VVENVENLNPELYVEIFRDSPDVVVFEHREIQGCYAWADHDVATCVAAEVEAS